MSITPTKVPAWPRSDPSPVLTGGTRRAAWGQRDSRDRGGTDHRRMSARGHGPREGALAARQRAATSDRGRTDACYGRACERRDRDEEQGLGGYARQVVPAVGCGGGMSLPPTKPIATAMPPAPMTTRSAAHRRGRGLRIEYRGRTAQAGRRPRSPDGEQRRRAPRALRDRSTRRQGGRRTIVEEQSAAGISTVGGAARPCRSRRWRSCRRCRGLVPSLRTCKR